MSARSSESVAASAARPEFKSSIEVATRASVAADTIIDTADGGKFPGIAGVCWIVFGDDDVEPHYLQSNTI